MTQPIFQISDMGKQYKIGLTVDTYRSLREDIAGFFGGATRAQRFEKSHFWALRHLTFDVMPGEAVGIIGRNGAGKSTLLKILSRITPPTEGRIVMRGRVGALLEVGTGFHPELTGRENIYLNGSILGMTKREIDGKFDEIVAFAGVEKFLDTPVKRYSSGMRVRLGFAVAAHLEPEILVIDEVLSVGDAEFRRKCLGKMQDVAGGGRTVLFVSHNLSAVRGLCTRAILLDQGRIVKDGDVDEVVDLYLNNCLERAQEGEVDLANWRGERGGKGPGRILAIRTLDDDGRVPQDFGLREPLTIECDLDNIRPQGFKMSAYVENAQGVRVYYFRPPVKGFDTAGKGPRATLRIRVPSLAVVEGEYMISMLLRSSTGQIEDQIERALSFRVVNRQVDDRKWPAVVDETGEWRVL